VSKWTAFDDYEHFMGGIVCPTGLRLMTVNTLWGHFVSDWTAFDDCEHFMGALCIRLD